MNNRRLALLPIMLLQISASVVSADTIWLAGEKEPIYGIVDSSDATNVSFRRTADGKEFESMTLARSEIESIVTSFDEARLVALIPGDWGSWHRYAEELIPQKRDPVAHTLAMRLLVIVAANTSEAQRDAALADLISLARNEDQREKLHRLRYLETGVLPLQKKKEVSKAIPNANDRLRATRLVRSIRNGVTIDNLLQDEQVKATVNAFKKVCSWEELVKISKSNRIDQQHLRTLVALEYQLRVGESEGTANRQREVPWHFLAGRTGSKTLSLPTIGNATEFDPTQTRYADGRWTAN